jgi:hypothetical protein
MPQIFIGGDSWGTGELPELKHKGLEQYFREDGYTVFNSSTRGASNRDSVGLLLESLKLNFKPDDLVFWIQTDPVRNLRPYVDLPKELDQAGSLRRLMTQLLSKDYDRLHSIARRFDTKIYMIGGLTSLDVELLTARPRLHNLITSWVELLVSTEYVGTDWRNFSICNSDYTIKNFGNNLSKELVEELYAFDQNRRVFDNRLFHPDGFHPNREGHRMLYMSIKNNLNIETLQ